MTEYAKVEQSQTLHHSMRFSAITDWEHSYVIEPFYNSVQFYRFQK